MLLLRLISSVEQRLAVESSLMLDDDSSVVWTEYVDNLWNDYLTNLRDEGKQLFHIISFLFILNELFRAFLASVLIFMCPAT